MIQTTQTTPNPLQSLNNQAAIDELRGFVARSRTPKLRSMRQFAVDEVVIPEGESAGFKLRIHRQPYAGLLFDAIDDPRFNRKAITGCVQSGKTLCGFVVPAMFHLFEIKETVIVGVPTMDVAGDKWREEILPVIERSRFRDLLPTSGKGSRGGKFESIKFRHGPTLKFMSGSGGDEKRSAFTSRVVIATEVDKYDTAGEASDESDPISQLEARTESYANNKVIYLECTVSVEKGRIWSEYIGGTQSRIACPCPHCSDWVTPEREHLLGFEGCEDALSAEKEASFYCPSCGEAIDDAQRYDMNQAAKLVHHGQTIDSEGNISGDIPATRTLGFRWNAFNNLFWPTGFIAAKEWKAKRAADEDNAEKNSRQFTWALPYEAPEVDMTPLDPHQVRRRFTPQGFTKSIVPENTQWLTVGVDLRKRFLHWVAPSWLNDPRGHIVDYGVMDIPSDSLGVEIAMPKALDDFADMIESSLIFAGGQARVPDQVWIDAGYQTDIVYDFCRRRGNRYRPIVGRGFGQQRMQWYNRPKRTGSVVKFIGQQFHISWVPKSGIHLVEINSDFWKSWLHDVLAIDQEKAGAMTLYNSTNAHEHMTLAKQLTAEKKVEKFIEGKGTVQVWETVSRSNHFLDASYMACAAGSFCGFTLNENRPVAVQNSQQESQTPQSSAFNTPDGRPFLATAREP